MSFPSKAKFSPAATQRVSQSLSLAQLNSSTSSAKAKLFSTKAALSLRPAFNSAVLSKQQSSPVTKQKLEALRKTRALAILAKRKQEKEKAEEKNYLKHAAQDDLAGLRKIGDNAWESPAGLRYIGFDRKGLTRVEHVLRHAEPDPSRAVHTVFNVPRHKILDLVDEAWKKRGKPLPNDLRAFLIPMGRPIGTKGETTIRIAVDLGTSDIMSAYPEKIE